MSRARPPLLCSVFFAILGAALAASPVWALDKCSDLKKNAPDMYEYYCRGKEGQKAADPAGTQSTFNQSFNMAPGVVSQALSFLSAKLPTSDTRYGVETLTHRIRGNGRVHPDFSIVKGFHKFGAGLSTTKTSTFYGNDIIGRSRGQERITSFSSPEPKKSDIPNINFGAAFGLFEFEDWPSLNLGFSVRHNQITGTWGGGPALLMTWGRFSVGAGYTREKVSNTLGRTTFFAATAGVRLWRFEFQVDRLQDSSPLVLRPIHIASLTAHLPYVILTAAGRNVPVFDAQSGRDYTRRQYHYAAQVPFGELFSLGVLYNYVPGATSLGMQIFF